MKNSLSLCFALLAAFLLSSCGDSHDKLMKDQLAWTQDVTEVLEKVASGDMSASDAAEKMQKLGEEGEDFVKRKEALNKDVDPEELKKVAEKYQDEMMEAISAMMKAMMEVQASGKMTPELQGALGNMK
ncbi:MAG: hypothetical protein R3242_03250 [Akkermansiaceae bacterium]|nr:hypothetical protein [Akkermansiaceae bacterium]